MTNAALRRLMARQPDARALVSGIAEAIGSPVTVEDYDGRLLLGEVSKDPLPSRFPVIHEDARLGWVSGTAQAGAVEP